MSRCYSKNYGDFAILYQITLKKDTTFASIFQMKSDELTRRFDIVFKVFHIKSLNIFCRNYLKYKNLRSTGQDDMGRQIPKH